MIAGTSSGRAGRTGMRASLRDGQAGKAGPRENPVLGPEGGTMSMSPAAPGGPVLDTPDVREAAKTVAKFWWLWLAIGIAWIIAALVILQFDHASITTISIIVGVMFIAAGLQQFVIGMMADHLKWLFFLFGGLFVICGIVSFIKPEDTFAGIADILGFLFLIVGIWWTIRSFMTREVDGLWWIGLIAGMLMVLLAFWTSSQLLIHKSYTLLVFAGIWALMHGITDIVRAFQVRAIGQEL